jgi:outer membrane protein
MRSTIFLCMFIQLLGVRLSEAQKTYDALECVTIALNNSPQILKAGLSKDLTRQTITSAKANLWPTLGLGVNADNNYARTDIEIPVGPQTISFETASKYSGYAGVDLSMDIYNPQTYRQIEIAERQFGISEAVELKTAEDIAYVTLMVVAKVQINKEQIRVLQVGLTNIKENLAISTRRFESGLLRKVDFDRINVTEQTYIQQIMSARLSLAQNINQLNYYMGLSDTAAFEIRQTPSSSYINIDSLAMLNADSIHSYLVETEILKRQYVLLDAQKKLVNSTYLPTLRLSNTSAFAISSSNLKDYNAPFVGSVGLSLTMPVFTGTRVYSKRKEVEIQKLMLDQQMADLTLQQKTEFKNALSQYVTMNNLLQSQSQNVSLAEEIMQIKTDQYQNGIIDLSELLNAQTDLTNAEGAYTQTYIQLRISEVALMKTSGTISGLIKKYYAGKGS